MAMEALEGLKVLDFTWAIAGPWSTKYLSDFGAEVIKIENSAQVDPLRVSEPYKDNVAGLDRSLYFTLFNTGKKSITLNLKNPKARKIMDSLIAWADVVTENYRPGVMARLGLGYEDLVKINPRVILASLSAFGDKGESTGWYRTVRGWGSTSMAISGIYSLIGWPDRPPAWPTFTYADVVGGPFMVSAILAAVDYRKRTGKGQHIDMSQMEIMIHLLATLFVDSAINHRRFTRMGNRCDYAVPHGAFRCKGEDEWCTIAVFNDEQWANFCKAMNNPAWTREYRFASAESRQKNQDDLERFIEQWTVNYTPQEVVQRLQSLNIPSGMVQDAADLVDADPQLKQRGSFVKLSHPAIGLCNHTAPPFKLSRTPAQIRTAPCLGEHNEYVASRILGLSDTEFVELLESGAFQ